MENSEETIINMGHPQSGAIMAMAQGILHIIAMHIIAFYATRWEIVVMRGMFSGESTHKLRSSFPSQGHLIAIFHAV